MAAANIAADLLGGEHRVFDFTVDICASDHNHKLDRYYTESDNALTKTWFGERVWCNPPYGRALPNWMDKFLKEKDYVESLVTLLPLSAKTRWFHKIKGSGFTMCMVKGALKFVPAVYPAPFSSVLIIWGDLTPEQTEYLNSIDLVVYEK